MSVETKMDGLAAEVVIKSETRHKLEVPGYMAKFQEEKPSVQNKAKAQRK